MLLKILCALGLIIFFILEFYVARSYLKNKSSKKEALKILEEFTRHGPKISTWLREHLKDLQTNPMATLNHPEFVQLVNDDQKLYERVAKKYPDYPDTIMQPKELHQYLIELVQGKYKQTH